VVNAKTKRKAVVNSEMKTKTAVDACSPMAREIINIKKVVNAFSLPLSPPVVNEKYWT
jgi:hypothetical protein